MDDKKFDEDALFKKFCERVEFKKFGEDALFKKFGDDSLFKKSNGDVLLKEPTEDELRVFEALCELGEANLGDVAEKTELQISTTLQNLIILVGRGLVGVENNDLATTTYWAKDHKEFEKRVEAGFRRCKEAIDEVRRLREQGLRRRIDDQSSS